MFDEFLFSSSRTRGIDALRGWEDEVNIVVVLMAGGDGFQYK